jgi:eukaryotic-like serine/threonine-protein kinase
MGGIDSFSSGGAVYRFSRRIGRGGMGEVYLGLQEGIGGLERLVVIKRIYSQFGEDENFTRMLLDEARLAASIRHPNVVQILDIGHDADGYFIVMEYLSGETLIYISRSLRARGESVPPAVACRIAAEVAAGLHCAHTATDPAGQPQPIVHRDVTPSNLIACFNGVVKIVDFGVAKATLHEGHTRGGVKGKMAYLAPEQLYDQPIDGRTDVFQLGVCLHEFLTGERLFKGESDHQRAVSVLEQRIPPPSELVPALPKVVDDAVLWALERDPARRPASADELRRAMESAAAEVGHMSAHDLGGWMRNALAERLAERTQFERRCVAEMREERSASGESPAMNIYESASRSAGGASAVSRPGLADGRELPVAQPIGLSPPPSEGESHSHSAYARSQPPGTGSAVPPTLVSRHRTALGAIGAVVLLAGGIAVASQVGSSSEPAPASAAEAAPAPLVRSLPPPAKSAAPVRQFQVAIAVEPAHAVIELDGVKVGSGSFRTTLPADGTRHILTVRAAGYEAVGLDFVDRPPPPMVSLDPVKRAPERASRSPAPRRSAQASGGRDRSDRARADKTPDRAPAKAPEQPDKMDDPVTDNPDPWAEEGGSD